MAEGFKRAVPRLAAVALATGTFFGAQAAQAQPFFGFFGYRAYSTPSTLPPEAVYRQLVRTGYQPLGRIQRNGSVFVADVIDPRRRQLRLVIDSTDGTILERYMIAAHAATSDELGVSAAARPPEVRTPAKPKSEARTASRAATQERGADRNKAVAPIPAPEVIPAPIPQDQATRPETATRSERPLADRPAASSPAPASPAPTAQRREPSAPARADGPGYANGVPINPLD